MLSAPKTKQSLGNGEHYSETVLQIDNLSSLTSLKMEDFTLYECSEQLYSLTAGRVHERRFSLSSIFPDVPNNVLLMETFKVLSLFLGKLGTYKIAEHMKWSQFILEMILGDGMVLLRWTQFCTPVDVD